jgi:hypothetical protein
MAKNPNAQPLGKRQLAVLIHALLMGSLIIYLLVVEIGFRAVIVTPEGGRAETFPSLRYVFYGIAVLLVLVVRRLPAWLLPGGDAPEPLKSTRLLQASVLTSALCEVPAILGLVIVLLTGSFRDFHYLLFFSLVLFVFHFPRRDYWESGGEG